MFTNLLAWVQSLISDAVEALVNLVLGHIANLNGLEGFVQIFPVAGTLYSYLQTVGMLMVVLIAAIGLYKFFFTPDAQDSPIRIGAMVAASVVCIYSGNYALEAIFNLANTVFTALKDVNAVQMNLHLTGLGLLEGTAEAGAAIVGGPAVGTALVVGAGVMALLSIIYAVLVWMTMWKLIKICVGHYVYIGVLIFTSPVAWPTMISRSTSPIFSRWLSLFAGECMCYILSVFGIKMALSAFAIGQIAGRTDTVQADIVVRIIAGNVIVQIVTSIDSWLKSVGVGAMPVSSGGGGVLAPLGAAASLVGTNLVRNAARTVWEGTGARSKIEGFSAEVGRRMGWRDETADLLAQSKQEQDQMKIDQMLHGRDTADAIKDMAKECGVTIGQSGLNANDSGDLAKFVKQLSGLDMTEKDLENKEVNHAMNSVRAAMQSGEINYDKLMNEIGDAPVNRPMDQMLSQASRRHREAQQAEDRQQRETDRQQREADHQQREAIQMHSRDIAGGIRSIATDTGVKFDQYGLREDGSGKSDPAEFAARVAAMDITDDDFNNRDTKNAVDGVNEALYTGAISANDVIDRAGDSTMNEHVAQMLANASVADQVTDYETHGGAEGTTEIASTFGSMGQAVKADVAGGYTEMLGNEKSSDSMASQIRGSFIKQFEDAVITEDKRKLSGLGFDGQGNSTNAVATINEYNKGNLGDQIGDFRKGEGTIEGGNSIACAFDRICASRGEQFTKTLVTPEQYRNLDSWAKQHGSTAHQVIYNLGMGNSAGEFMSNGSSFNLRNATLSALNRSSEGRASPISARVSGTSAGKINVELNVKGQNKRETSLSAGKKKPVFGIMADK